MWRYIKGYEGLYEINEEAVVRRLDGKGVDGRRVSTHVVMSSRTKKGTRYIALWKDGKRKTYMLHKLYAAAFQISENEAVRRLYRGFTGNGEAIHNVRRALLYKLRLYEREQAEGVDRNDEILYIRQFLQELNEDMEEKYINTGERRRQAAEIQQLGMQVKVM